MEAVVVQAELAYCNHLGMANNCIVGQKDLENSHLAMQATTRTLPRLLPSSHTFKSCDR
jgi:hypothetical protein